MKVKVTVKSIVDGEVYKSECVGECEKLSGEYRLAYSDLSGNMITNNYLQVRKENLLLRREGGFGGEMLFDPMCDTVVKYSAVMLEHCFALHTREYTLTDHKNGFDISLRYGLNDGTDEDVSGEQKISVTFE